MILSAIDETHSDFHILRRIKHSLLSRVSEQALLTAFPMLVRNALTFVLDPYTGRTRVEELDKNEKTFIASKIEYRLRALFGVPKGKRDLWLDDIGVDLDVKSTIGRTWMVPPESFDDPCLLVEVNDEAGTCRLGLIVARLEYLNAPNRDLKRSISAKAFQNIVWLVESIPFPAFAEAPQFQMI